jgi:predicted Zn-dependent peptidase
LKEFENVSKELDENELNQVKEQLVGNENISMEDSQNQMLNLLSEEISGKAEDFYEFEKNIRNVKLEDVKKMAGDVGKAYSFFALIPE